MSLLRYFPKKARLDSGTVDCEQHSSHLEPSTEVTELNVDVLSSLSSDVNGSSDSEQSESDTESATNTATRGRALGWHAYAGPNNLDTQCSLTTG